MLARFLTLGFLALSPAASAQEDLAAVFGKKTITIVVGNTAGGNYDLMARLTSRHLGKHIPGRPNIIVENMPGAGSLRAANFIYGAAPKDGTALGIVTENVALEQALKNSAVQYDTSKVTWIGRVATSGAIHMMWHTSKVQSLEDAKKVESTVAGTGAGNLAEVIPMLLNALIGTKFKIVRGYPAANEALLAMERGEVEGASSNWLTIKHGRPDWVRDRKIKVILQDQTTRARDLQDTPALGELGDTPEAKQLFGLYASTGVIGRSFFAPPGVPALNVKILRDGFAALAKDAEFIAEAQRMRRLEIAFHEELEREVAKTLAAPASAIARAQAIFKQ